MKALFKCLAAGGRSKHNFRTPGNNSPFWPLPTWGQPGDWKFDPPDKPLVPHFSGIHLCEAKDLVLWFGAENYFAESSGEIASTTDAVVTRRARLLQPLEVSPEQWHALTLQWLDDVRRLPTRVGYKWEFQYFVEETHKIITHRWQGGLKTPAAPLEHSRLAALRQMAAAQLQDSGCTSIYAENCLAMHHMALAYGGALENALGLSAEPAWQVAKAVATHTRHALVHEALQSRHHREAQKPEIRIAIAAQQNRPLATVLGLT